MPQFFYDGPDNDIIEVTGEEARHIRDAFRSKAGERIRLFNGKGLILSGVIESIDKHAVSVRVEEKSEEDKSRGEFILAQSLISGDLFDFVLQKATELGISRIVPLQCSQGVVRLKSAKFDSKLSHWNGVIRAACKQSGRVFLPQVTPPSVLKDFLTALPPDTAVIAAHPQKPQSLADILCEAGKSTPLSIAFVIGPEGGFSEEEIDLLEDSGAHFAGLGETVLRSETAALYLASVIKYTFGL